MDWRDRTQVKKGDLGESLVDKYLISKDLIPYLPGADGAHPFDRLVASRDKKTIFIADVKAKACRKYYPDTGIDQKHYDEYVFIANKYSIRVFLFFVDEMKRKIYGNYLDMLSRPTMVNDKNRRLSYPMIDKGIIYFPLLLMLNICDMSDSISEELKKLSTRNYDYADS